MTFSGLPHTQPESGALSKQTGHCGILGHILTINASTSANNVYEISD